MTAAERNAAMRSGPTPSSRSTSSLCWPRVGEGFSAMRSTPEKWSGFAFGFGIDRLVQLLYGIDHIKNIWDGDVRFAAQF